MDPLSTTVGPELAFARSESLREGRTTAASGRTAANLDWEPAPPDAPEASPVESRVRRYANLH